MIWYIFPKISYVYQHHPRAGNVQLPDPATVPEISLVLMVQTITFLQIGMLSVAPSVFEISSAAKR